MPLLNHDQITKNEIRRALNAGKDVTTHTDKVSISGGWSGFGYIITDPVVGDGVYKISGGLNGGFLFVLVILLFTAIFVAIALAPIGGFAFLDLFALEYFSFLSWIDSMKKSNSYKEFRDNSVKTILNGLLNFFPATKIFGSEGKAIRWFLDAITTMLSNPFGWFA